MTNHSEERRPATDVSPEPDPVSGASTAAVTTGGPIFVVGSSRSGTTMVGRILGAHPNVFTFHELHFFEELWSPDEPEAELGAPEGRAVLERLFSRQRRGYLAGDDGSSFEAEASALFEASAGERDRLGLFRAFLAHEARRAGKTVPCDQTPRNAYYAREILDAFPEARIVAMVRDPRSVLLSQKNKWKRHFLGAKNIPLTEALRAWVNYHPYTITKLWAASARRVLELADHPRVELVRFEDLVAAPERVADRIARFVGLELRDEMLAVPRIGSSVRPDTPGETGIDPGRAAGFRAGGLGRGELHVCQRTAGDLLDRLGYDPEPGRLSAAAALGFGLLWPLKTGAALLLNLRRMKNVREAIRRRLA